MASAHLEYSSSIVAPTPSRIFDRRTLNVSHYQLWDISIYSTDDGVTSQQNAQQNEIFFTMNGPCRKSADMEHYRSIDSNGNITVTGGPLK